MRFSLSFVYVCFVGLCFSVSGWGQSKKMEVRQYSVAPNFLSALSGMEPAVDPFEIQKPAGPGPKGAKEGLIQLGVTFREGSLVNYNPTTSILMVKNTPDELARVEAILKVVANESPRKVHIFYEWIEVDHGDFSDWLFENTLTEDGTELRNEVQKWITAGKAEVLEFSTIVAKSGQRAKTQAIDEYIYPTEYDPAEIPNSVTLKDGAVAPTTPVNPTAFETRNMGMTLEVDPVIGADDVTVDLNLSPEIVELEQIDSYHPEAVDPKFKTLMPRFYTMKITTQVTALSGQYTFLGTTRPLKAADPKRKNPIVLQFVRPDVSALGAWKQLDGKKVEKGKESEKGE